MQSAYSFIKGFSSTINKLLNDDSNRLYSSLTPLISQNEMKKLRFFAVCDKYAKTVSI